MRKNPFAAAVAVSLAAAMTLTACGSRSETPAGGTGSGAAATKTVKIGVIAPLTGSLSAMGLGIKNSVDLAVKQANESNAIPGWKIEIVAEDDTASPDVGRNAATKLAGDKDVVGIVGPLNSGVGQALQPVLAPANIALISPANTNPTLTRGAQPVTAPKRAYANYYRTCTTDVVQGGVAAQYLIENKLTNVATVHDKKPYGQGLVEAMTAALTQGGGKVVSAQTINQDDKDFSTVIAQIKAQNPQVVYFGGEYPVAGPFSKQMKAAGLNIPLMGGDGIYDDTFIKDNGAPVTGDYATSVGAPAADLPSAQAFIKAYQAAGYKDGYSAYGAYSYDAAQALIAAMKVSLKDKSDVQSARAATATEVGKVNLTGATGQVAFDDFGDTKARVISIYQVKDGKWTPLKTMEMK